MALPLDSDRHFPFSYATEESAAPSLAEFSPLVEPQVPNEQLGEHAVPSRQHEVPLTTPYSFAQVSGDFGVTCG